MELRVTLPALPSYQWHVEFPAVSTGFAVLDSDGNSFACSQNVLDSDGNSFAVSGTVLDSDGNGFSVI